MTLNHRHVSTSLPTLKHRLMLVRDPKDFKDPNRRHVITSSGS